VVAEELDDVIVTRAVVGLRRHVAKGSLTA
jgi:hypothetical protein